MSKLGASLLSCLVGAAVLTAPALARGSAPAAPGEVAGEATSPTAPAVSGDGTLALFGKVICFPGAAPSADCDLDLRPREPVQPVSTTTDTWEFLGFRLCASHASADADCDLRLPPAQRQVAPAPSEPRARVWNAFGLTFCFGEGVTDRSCDVQIPAHPEEGGQRRAEL